jgi:hypothetical protein
MTQGFGGIAGALVASLIAAGHELAETLLRSSAASAFF